MKRLLMLAVCGVLVVSLVMPMAAQAKSRLDIIKIILFLCFE